jgi:uncharacterized protein (TIGR02118 family)
MAMHKIAALARFPEGQDKEATRRHWAGTHGSLGRKVPGLDRYVQNHVVGPLPGASGVSEEEVFFDGYACCWFADTAAFDAALATPEWAELVADGPNVFDMEWLSGMTAAVDERTIKDGPPDPYKVVWVARFKEGLPRAEASEYWTQTHGPLAVKAPGISRYVQNHVVVPFDGVGSDEVEVGFDGFSECWFADEAAFLRAVTSPEWEALVEDGHNVFDMTQMWGARIEERVIK